eukprot:481712-Amphidinium_carterae.2
MMICNRTHVLPHVTVTNLRCVQAYFYLAVRDIGESSIIQRGGLMFDFITPGTSGDGPWHKK